MNRNRPAALQYAVKSYDIVRLSDVKEEEITYLWEPYIPFGKITIFEGDGESGKSYLTLFVAALLSQGKRLAPYDTNVKTGFQPGNTMLLASEDGLGDTIHPRFTRLKGDHSRFFQLKGITLEHKDCEDADR